MMMKGCIVSHSLLHVPVYTTPLLHLVLFNRFNKSFIFIIPCLGRAESGNIETGLVHPRTFHHDGCMDFLHIGYHDQLQRVAHSYKMQFGSVPNLSNYDYFFLNYECLLCYPGEEYSDFVHIWLCAKFQ